MQYHVTAGHVLLSLVSDADYPESQLIYSSNFVSPSCETMPVGTACAGISLEIYCPIWEGRVCACVCHKRKLRSPVSGLSFILLGKKIKV